MLCPITCTDTIEQFTFLLIDEHNRQLQLKPGPTTLLQLLFVMTDAHALFTMTVSANTSRELFSQNSQHSWEVEMPETLTFRDHWEVALLSAQVDNWMDLENVYAKFVLHNGIQMMVHQDDAFAAHEDDQVLSIPLRGGRTMSPQTLFKSHLGQWLNEHGLSISLTRISFAREGGLCC